MSKLPINPFAENIVGEPRRIETPVTGLNDHALLKLTNAFEFLTEVPLPRVNRRVPHALLVTSVEPGYGKSHLLGRLFRKLEHRATLIYVRPFQDPSSCWRSLLDRLAMELEYPNRADAVACTPSELSQLDVFARHVLAFLLVPLIERGEIKAKDKAKAITYLSNQPDQAFQNPNLVNWLKKNFQTLLGRLENTLREVGVFHGGRTAWIKILFAYACEPASSHLRNTCLDWIKYQPLEEEEAKQISLRRAELPEVDLPYDQRNEKCSERILDLLKLASFYRPFVLCFDQTELYENSPDLAKRFGQVVRHLLVNGENLLIVITANKQVWDSKIFENFQHADKHSIEQPPILLQGINSKQAQELASNRLHTWEVDENKIQEFLDPRWLDKLFETKVEISARGFINECSQRWEGTTKPDLRKAYDTYQAKLLHKPRSQIYEAGVLQWVFQEVFNGESSLKIEQFKSNKGYLSLRWIRDSACVYFGFEEGDHFKRWEAILNEAKRYHSHDQHNHITSRSVFFRVPGQKPIPGQNWRIRAEFEKASQALAIFHLNQEEVASLYAAHDLYADVAQGNQPFAKEETLRFLAKELHGWIERVTGSSPAKPIDTPIKTPPPELIDAMRSIVSTIPYINLNMVQNKLARCGLTAEREQIFKAAEMIPEIKVFSTLTNAVFKWN